MSSLLIEKLKENFVDCPRILEEFVFSPEDDDLKVTQPTSEGSYSRTLLYDCECFTVLLLAWAPGAYSQIHDHPGVKCWMKVCKGAGVEEIFDKDNDKVLKTSTEMPCGRVFYMDDSLGLHRIHNASKENIMYTLHVYAPPLRWCHNYCDGQKSIVRLSTH
jgi:predicted metal-dependent enzyme (double-stranded beta helix superfamily)